MRYLWANDLTTPKVNRLADIIMMVTTLLIVAALASIMLTSSYKKLWRSMLKNGSTFSVVGTVTKNCAPIVEKEAEEVSPEAMQASVEENQCTQDTLRTESEATLTNVQEKTLGTPLNIEQPVIVPLEATQQQVVSPEEIKEATLKTSRVRRKKSTTRTRSTKRSRKKVSEASTTESQPLS